jgi:hypothetical protein
MGRVTRTALPVACALTAAVTLIPGSAARAGVMRIGRRPVVPVGAVAKGTVAPRLRLHVTVTLKPRNPAALNAYAEAVSTPGSRSYRQYLTPSQFGRRFGATAAEVRAVRRSLRAQGLDPGSVTPGSLSIPVFATAARLERALRISLRRLALPGRRTAVAANAAPAVQASAAGAVQAVVGLDTVSAPHPLLARPGLSVGSSARSARASSAGSVGAARAHAAAAAPHPCAAAQTAATAQHAHTADQIASTYGFDGLYDAGDLGSGVTVAVYELEPVSANDIGHYQLCYGTHTSIKFISVDGGVGTGPGTGESALDIENLIGLAPEAKVLVYDGRNSSSGAPGSGPFDTFRTIIDQDRAQVISVSWGECEAALGAADAAAEHTLFEQAAVQGQTIVAAAGDSGSEDCAFGSDLRQIQLAVDDPSSQPFVTGVGGTSLTAVGPPPTESVWNSSGVVPGDLAQPGASGGGISDLWQMPAGQRDASAALNVLAAGRTGGQCGHSGGYCREVPDVSADADPTTGYLIYYNGSGTELDAPVGWQGIGGTSAAAPVWAALMALADASSACANGPIGYAVPALYRAASTSYAADFNDVVTGNNDYTETNGGRFAARPGYDEASGLGTPNATPLAASLCAGAVHLTAVRAQHSAAGASVSIQLHARDGDDGPLRFRATGLPPGVSVDSVTGRISGRPRRGGTYHVTASAEERQGATAGAKFTWSVGAATRILDTSLIGVGRRRPALTFTVTTGQGAPPMSTLSVDVPKELRVVSATGVRLAARGTIRFSTQASRQTVTIELARAFHRVTVTISYPALQISGARHPDERGITSPELGVTVVDAQHGSSHLHVRL